MKEDQFLYSLVLEGLDYRGRQVKGWVSGGEGTSLPEVIQRALLRTSDDSNEIYSWVFALFSKRVGF